MEYSTDIHLKIKAVIFDWDLTLWNSWDIHLELMNWTAAVLGYPRPIHGDLAVEYSRPFLEHLAWFFPGDQEMVLKTYMDYYRAVVWQDQRLYKGIPELIRQLKNHAYLTGILSDKRQVFGIPEFEFSELGNLIDRAVFFSDEMSPKPDPAGLKDVMESLGVCPEECLFIGDSHRDIECAKRAGAWSGAAMWASVEPELVIALRPEFIWDNVGDVAVTLNLRSPS